MKLLFVMDPLERIHPQRDTTYVLINEGLRRGAAVYICEARQLFFENGEVFTRCRKFTEWKTPALAPSVHSLSDFAYTFMRSDPPVDLNYLTAAQILVLGAKQTRVVNNPAALIAWNEKLSTLRFFKEHCPETLISGDAVEIRRFVEAVGGKAIIKPLHFAGGERVFRLELGDSNFNVIVETATHWGREAVAVQRFLPDVKKGDKRIIVIDGEPIACLLRVSQGADHRSNLHIGGASVKAALTDHDRKICQSLKADLLREGLFFVGLDVIGRYLTEINVTSPTCFQEINALESRSGEQTLEAIFFDKLLKKT